MRVITIPDQENAIAILKKANYEVLGRQQIINFMITNGLKEHTHFKDYWQEYLDYTAAYELLKEEFKTKYIIPIVGDDSTKIWEVDFINNEVRIHD